jgi:hypothetical protein
VIQCEAETDNRATGHGRRARGRQGVAQWNKASNMRVLGNRRNIVEHERARKAAGEGERRNGSENDDDAESA